MADITPAVIQRNIIAIVEEFRYIKESLDLIDDDTVLALLKCRKDLPE
jgi:hypothetical protein